MDECIKAAADPEVKLRSCKHKDCKYRTLDKNRAYGCDYATLTGHTRLAQHPPDKQQPRDCMLYEPANGKKRGRPRKNLILP